MLTAGYGSRLFPVTSVVPKSLMPIGRYPVVHHVLADLAAGIEDIAVVVGAGDDGVERYVRGDPRVAESFRVRGWSSKYEVVQRVHDELAAASFTFIEQDLGAGAYGTAVPARLAADFIADRDCFYLSGDDLLLDPNSDRNTADLDRLRFSAVDATAAMQVTLVDPTQAHLYGIVSTLLDQQDRVLLDRLVEKSAVTTGTRANISRYFLTSALMDEVRHLEPDEVTGELMITTAIQALSIKSPVGVSVAAGQYFDCGNADGWLAANVAVADRSMA